MITISTTNPAEDTMTKEQMEKRLEANLKVAIQDQRSPIRSAARHAAMMERRAREALVMLRTGVNPDACWQHVVNG